VSAKDRLEWGYRKAPSGDADSAEDNWNVVDVKSVDSNDVQRVGIEKIGFEGTPDPNSGYYCVYDEGRLSNTDKGVPPKKLN